MRLTRWKRAQKAERSFWEWINSALGESTFRSDVADYFSKVLGLTGITFDDNQRFLDIGSGPLTVFLALNKGKRTALDPLMDYYLGRFPALQEMQGVEWVSGKVEEFRDPGVFDAVFMFNCLNHCENLPVIVERMGSLVAENGYLVITQHCHTQPYTRAFFRRMNFIVDTCHPHQFIKEDVPALFKDKFKLVREINIDALDVERAVKTRRSVRKRGFFRRAAGFLFVPGRFTGYINSLVCLFFRKEMAGKSAQANHLFVFKKTDGPE